MQLMLVGRVLTDGRLNARVKCDLTENLSLKANSQVICNIVRGVSPPIPPPPLPFLLFMYSVLNLLNDV